SYADNRSPAQTASASISRTDLQRCWFFPVAFIFDVEWLGLNVQIRGWIYADSRRHCRTDRHAFKVATLRCRWTGPHNGFNHRISIFHQRLFFERKFANRHRDVAVLIELEFYTARLRRLTLREDKHAHLFSAAVGKRASPAHHLIRLLRVNPEAERDRHRLIKLCRWKLLQR